MLKYDADAMRAFVKYKPLKKLIAKCINKESLDDSTTTKETEKSPDMDNPDEEINVEAMKEFIKLICIVKS